jgi:hypothetical protein
MSNPLPPPVRQELSIKDWVTVVTVEGTLHHQSRMMSFLFCSYAFLIVTTMLIFFLEGFHFKGFNLEAGLLRWLGGATVGEIGGLLTLTFRAVFRKAGK